MTIRCWLGTITFVWTMCCIVVASDGAMHLYMVMVMMIIGWMMEIAVVMMVCMPCVYVTMIAMIT